MSGEISATEGKMFGLLLVRNETGRFGYLKAFSGKWKGSYHHSGWAPPIFELGPTPSELETKRALKEIKDRLSFLKESPVWEHYERLQLEYQRESERLNQELRLRRSTRQQARLEKTSDMALLDQESREDSRLKRQFKNSWNPRLQETKGKLSALEAEIASLKSKRRQLSRALQKEMHQALDQGFWQEEAWSLSSLFPAGPPTGTGDCCTPKLLSFAKRNGLQPLALAEFWCGPDTASKKAGEFYPACQSRCAPLLGPLLSDKKWESKILLEDQHFLLAEKPSGLLSVPGKEKWNQDSLLTRLARKKKTQLFSVHRLDLETSGLLLLAKTKDAQAKLQELFQKRLVHKTYEALLTAEPEKEEGLIELSLGRDPETSHLYKPDPEGRECTTKFRKIDGPRVEFQPITGRSHQLRLHAAFGLGHPIEGDRLYGKAKGTRLKLHATRLEFQHPFTNERVLVESPCPF